MTCARSGAVPAVLLSGVFLCAAGAAAHPPVRAGQPESADEQTTAPSGAVADRLTRVRADLFSRAPKVDDDIRELKSILGVDPNLAEAHLLLGMAYRMRASPDFMGEAVAELRQALALEPAMVPARFYLASVYLDLGRTARAREELEAALKLHPRHPQFMALLGEAERQMRNPARAIELTRGALEAEPSFSQARYYLGLALRDAGQHAEAVRELEQVVKSGASPAQAYLGLGAVYLDAGRADDALGVLRQAIKMDPARPDVRVQLARAYRLKGQLKEADVQLKTAAPAASASVASINPQLELDFALEEGLVRMQQDRLDAAAIAFQRVLDMDAAHAEARRQLAAVRRLQDERRKKTGGGR